MYRKLNISTLKFNREVKRIKTNNLSLNLISLRFDPITYCYSNVFRLNRDQHYCLFDYEKLIE